MRYKLWDTDIGKLFGTFVREDEAMSLVRTLTSSYGPESAGDLELIIETDEGDSRGSLSGRNLLARANEVLTGPGEAPSGPGNVFGSHESNDTRSPLAANQRGRLERSSSG
ncbi:MAG TPA: hypothetical protein VGR16_11150 [Thermomicrobiales bacterium]|nr:hypothetical protein [Thermomicrobiales bacterium]